MIKTPCQAVLFGTTECWEVRDADGVPVANCGQETADFSASAAALEIAMALNSHKAMLESCKRVLRGIDWTYTEDRLSHAQQTQLLSDAIHLAETKP